MGISDLKNKAALTQICMKLLIAVVPKIIRYSDVSQPGRSLMMTSDPMCVPCVKLLRLFDVREGSPDRVGEDWLIENRHEGK